jgi:hypothetical protein
MCFDPPSYLASKHVIQDLKDYDPNLEVLVQRAKTDDGDALFTGSLLLLGGFELAPIDEVEATEWTRRGVVAKHPACAIAYGLHLRAGYVIGKPRDADRYVVLGKKWLLEASRDQNQPSALMLRAAVEEQGLGGFRRSKMNARKFCVAAADIGDPLAQFKLGQQYEEDSRRVGGEESAVAAFHWVRLSAEQGFAAAQRMLSVYLQNGFGTDKDLDASALWLFKAAKQHHPVAALEAGYWCRAQSKLVAAGSEEAKKLIDEMFNWYRVAGKNGLPMAEISMAYCHEEGLAVDQNKAIAYSMYHALALRDGRTFPTRHPNKREMDHIRRRMALLKQDCTNVERKGARLRMAWGEDEIIITEKPESARRNGTTESLG